MFSVITVNVFSRMRSGQLPPLTINPSTVIWIEQNKFRRFLHSNGPIQITGKTILSVKQRSGLPKTNFHLEGFNVI